MLHLFFFLARMQMSTISFVSHGKVLLRINCTQATYFVRADSSVVLDCGFSMEEETSQDPSIGC